MPAVTMEFTIERDIEAVWAFLTTPADVAPQVPGCEDYAEVEPDVFDATVGVTVAYTSLTFDARIELTEKSPPASLHVEGLAEPTGRMPGSATVSGDLELTDAGGDVTNGSIAVEFAIRGRLGSLGEGAFRSKCAALTEEFLDNVAAELEGREVADA